MKQESGHFLEGLNAPQNSFATYTWKQTLLAERVLAYKPDLPCTSISESKAVHKLHAGIRRVTLNEPLSYTLHFVSFEVFPVHIKHECISYHERKTVFLLLCLWTKHSCYSYQISSAQVIEGQISEHQKTEHNNS